jgi:hypothetical protein
MDKFRGFGRRDPAGAESCRFDAAELEHLLNHGDSLLRGIITIQVIAFAQVSATDKNPINPPLEGEKDMVR